MSRLCRLAGLGCLLWTAGVGAEPLDEIPTRDFFRPSQVQGISLVPGGGYVAVHLLVGGEDKVRVLDVDRGDQVSVLTIRDRPDAAITQLLWADADTLLITISTDRRTAARTGGPRESRTYVVDVIREGGVLVNRSFVVQMEGQVVDALAREVDEILYAPTREPSSVYRIRLSQLLRYREFSERWGSGDAGRFSEEARVARVPGRGLSWLSDRRGIVRLALTVQKDLKRRLLYRASPESSWRTIVTISPGSGTDIYPIGFSDAEGRLLVLSGRDRADMALYEFDPESGELGELIYDHPSGEIAGLVWDHSGDSLLGVRYLESGHVRYHYFEGRDRRAQLALEKAFPGRNVDVTGISADGERMTVLVSRSHDPGTHYHFDVRSQRAIEVGRVMPWLDPEDLVPIERFHVTSADGTGLDALLARPPGEALPPLVVLPHGGPIGVLDLQRFDSVVQFLANRGFAVLQVNYRGSGGYGPHFSELGLRQWGRGIEDDIDAAVDHVVARGSVDPHRMCIVGASYGGYSALMSVVRHPDRFRCAASWAGVTDIALLFNSSDFASSPEGRRSFARVVGDPESEYEEMKAFSPVYNAERIAVPILLAHGARDQRVDPEHAFRMKAMLELYERPFEWWLSESSGHGFASEEEETAFFSKLGSFLAGHLRVRSTGGPAGTGPSATGNQESL